MVSNYMGHRSIHGFCRWNHGFFVVTPLIFDPFRRPVLRWYPWPPSRPWRRNAPRPAPCWCPSKTLLGFYQNQRWDRWIMDWMGHFNGDVHELSWIIHIHHHRSVVAEMDRWIEWKIYGDSWVYDDGYDGELTIIIIRDGFWWIMIDWRDRVYGD